MTWIAFGIGLFVGTFVGILASGLCQMAGRSEMIQDTLLRDHAQKDVLAQPTYADITK